MPRPIYNRVLHCVGAMTLLLLPAVSVAPLLAHPESPSSPPLVPQRLRLKHQQPAGLIALFAREEPAGAGEQVPRAARADSGDSLLPAGIDALLRTSSAGEVVVVGFRANFLEMEALIRLLDVPVQTTGPDRRKVVLTPKYADPQRALRSIRRLPGGGSAALSGRKLTLEGTPGWLHRALRQVIRAELKYPETLGMPAR